MFYGCCNLYSINLMGFNTNKVTTMYNMFKGCSNLTTIYADKDWSALGITEGEDMFSECINLVGEQETSYSSLHTDISYAHVDGGTTNPGYFTDKSVQTKELYAVLSDNNSILSFYFDDQKESRNGMTIENIVYHPTFLYESMLNLIGLIILLIIRKKKNIKNGMLLSIYLMWYSLVRFFIESMRTDSLMLFSLI